jgi:polysaccharide biosynthesis/export protein
MRNAILLGFLVIYAGFPSACLSQVSTFPSPPPLPPLSQSGPETNAPPSGSAPLSQAATDNKGESDTNPASQPPALTGPVTAATITSMTALDNKVLLEPGDRISFRVIEDRDDAIPRIVTDTGEVDFPYIGRVKVEGQTCRQVALELKKLLEVDYYKRATVIVGLDVMNDHEKENHQLAWIVGQVRQVGPQEISPFQPVTVSQIILRAGGFGDFADQRKIRVIHRSDPSATIPAVESADASQSQEGEIIDVKAVFEGKSRIDPIVKPNDLIIVPKRLVNF